MSDLVGQSASFLRVLDEIKIIACSDANVLISGETGTGKDLCARAIHYTGARAAKPFVPINCGCVPEDLLENQFFGHERGAYTDARDRSAGLLQEADGGTLLLDDIEALTPKNQVKLHRFLQNGTYVPLGAVRALHANVRVIAATNESLIERIKERTFRDDLYYRLAVLTLSLPPLRERIDDIGPLAESFLHNYATMYAKPLESISANALNNLRDYSWPGNVRELENVMHRAVVHARGTELTDIDIPPNREEGGTFLSRPDTSLSFRQRKRQLVAEFEREYLITLLQRTGGNISEAARRSGKNRRALWELLRKYHLTSNRVEERE